MVMSDQIMTKRLNRLLLGGVLLASGCVQAAPVGSIEERIERLERMADNPVLLQMNQRLMQQQREVQRLHDEMDRLKRTQKKLSEQSAERYAETDERISQLEAKANTADHHPKAALPSTPAASGAKKTESVSIESQSETVVQTHPATSQEEEAYQKAFALMRAARYKESVEAFDAFVKQYPQSELASNASYWGGEGLLIQKSYSSALNLFQSVIERYPDSAKVPDAMLRAGDALRELQKEKEARALYQKLIRNHPDTRAAKHAQKRLAD